MPILRNCKRCKKEFKTKPFWVKQGKGLYCSNDCSFASRRKGKVMPCHICGEKKYKSPKHLRNSKSKLFFCSKSCQTKWRNRVFVGPKHANWIHGKSSYRSVLPRNKVLQVCNLCKIKDSRVLATHHVDENRNNNKLENLAYLCHNCHHLVHYHIAEKKKLMRILNKI